MTYTYVEKESQTNLSLFSSEKWHLRPSAKVMRYDKRNFVLGSKWRGRVNN